MNQKNNKYKIITNAFETIYRVPKTVTQTGAHIRESTDLKRVMLVVIISLLPSLFFGIYNTGYQYYIQTNGLSYSSHDIWLLGLSKVLPIIFVSYAVGLTIEFIFAIVRGHEIQEGFLVTGLLIAMIMPVDIPLWILAVSVAFAVIIGKEAFGGTGMNILNPALLARVFAFLSYPTYMSGSQVWITGASQVDAISAETLLGSLSNGNNLGYNFWDMFWGFIPGSIAETSTFLVIIGALILIFTGIGSYRIILGGFLGGSLMAILLSQIAISSLQIPWYHHLVLGGFSFGIVFMATDPVTATQTNIGKWIYGIMIGLLSILIRVINPAYPEGTMFAILLMNVFAPVIDHFVIERNIKNRLRRKN